MSIDNEIKARIEQKKLEARHRGDEKVLGKIRQAQKGQEDKFMQIAKGIDDRLKLIESRLDLLEGKD